MEEFSSNPYKIYLRNPKYIFLKIYGDCKNLRRISGDFLRESMSIIRMQSMDVHGKILKQFLKQSLNTFLKYFLQDFERKNLVKSASSKGYL